MSGRHVIIGGGPASVAAASAIRSRDKSASITVIAEEGYYSRPGLAYFLAKEVPESGLHPFSRAELADLNLAWVTGRAAKVSATAHEVELADGRRLAYDRLLLATGSRAIPAGVPGAGLDGVTKLDDLADARDLAARCRRARTAVVIGGGITALEIVEGLRARNVNVHYFVRKDRYWGNVLSESESRIVERGLEACGVKIHYFTQLARIVGKRGRVVAVETTDGATIPCELVSIAVGVLPRKRLAEEAGLACDRGVLVDEYLRSSDEDIFAAGDLAEVYDAATDRRAVEVLWNSAVVKGTIAGANMVGESASAYASGCPLNVTRLAGFKITIMGTVGSGEDADMKGVSRGDSETWRQAGKLTTVESTIGNANIRLRLSPSSIAGAVVMGDQTLSFPLQRIIGERMNVEAILDDLQATAAPIAELLTGFWRDAQVSNA